MSELTEQAARALRAALAAEEAAIWVYGLTTAFASESRVSTAMDDAMQTHQRQRDEAQLLVRAAGVRPPVAQPAYQLPEQVSDQTSAIRSVLVAERDCQVGWRSVLETIEDPRLRRKALDGLTTSATRATRWRLTIGEEPAAHAFPGASG